MRDELQRLVVNELQNPVQLPSIEEATQEQLVAWLIDKNPGGAWKYQQMMMPQLVMIAQRFAAQVVA